MLTVYTHFDVAWLQAPTVRMVEQANRVHVDRWDLQAIEASLGYLARVGNQAKEDLLVIRDHKDLLDHVDQQVQLVRRFFSQFINTETNLLAIQSYFMHAKCVRAVMPKHFCLLRQDI